MKLLWLLLIPKALCTSSVPTFPTEPPNASFLQAANLRRALASGPRAVQAYQSFQRPQTRVPQQTSAQNRSQKRSQTPTRESHRAFQRSKSRSSQQASIQQRFQQTVRAARTTYADPWHQPARAEPWHQPARSDAPVAPPRREPTESIVTPVLPQAGGDLQGVHKLSPATSTKDDLAMEELSVAASWISHKRRSATEQEMQPEASGSLRALQHLSLPKLDAESSSSSELLLASVFSPEEHQLKIQKASVSLKGFVMQTPEVAVFEVEATAEPLRSLMQGIHHLRLGFGTVEEQLAAYNSAEVEAAADEGRKHVQKTWKIYNRVMSRGFANFAEAVNKTGLLVTKYGTRVSTFGQQFAWVGQNVFCPVASITPSFECTLQDLLEGDSGNSSEQSDMSSARKPPITLSVEARELLALRVLTAVATLHSMGFSHGNIGAHSIVVNSQGNAYLSNLESAVSAGDAEACKTGLEDLEASTTTDAQTKEARTSTPLFPPATPAASSGDLRGDLCLVGPEAIKERITNESLLTGVLLYRVLSGGRLPLGLTKEPQSAIEVAALLESARASNESDRNLAKQLDSCGVSQSWQLAVTGLIGDRRLTAIQAAREYFPHTGHQTNASVLGGSD